MVPSEVMNTPDILAALTLMMRYTTIKPPQTYGDLCVHGRTAILNANPVANISRSNETPRSKCGEHDGMDKNRDAGAKRLVGRAITHSPAPLD